MHGRKNIKKNKDFNLEKIRIVPCDFNFAQEVIVNCQV